MTVSDDFVKAVAVTLLLAHFVAALWLRSRIGWIIALNLLVSAGAVVYWLPDITTLPGYIPMVWVFVGFEFAALAVSVAALFLRVPPPILWTVSTVHALLVAAAAVFMFTFQLTHLI